MHVNYEFLLDFSLENIQSTSANILDYGCGAAEVVAEGRKRGLNIFGAETFYEGGNTRPQVEQLGILGTIVTEIVDNRTSFPAKFFDLIVNNQVLEHVENLEAVLDEFDRLLKPDGKVLSLFPSKEVWWEGHRLIPFLHWFPNTSSVRLYYAYIWRLLGGGAFKKGKTKMEWAKYSCDWIDKYTYYRKEQQINDVFLSHFKTLSSYEVEYLLYRLKRNKSKIYPLINILAHSLTVREWLGYAVRKRSGMVIVSERATD